MCQVGWPLHCAEGLDKQGDLVCLEHMSRCLFSLLLFMLTLHHTGTPCNMQNASL